MYPVFMRFRTLKFSPLFEFLLSFTKKLSLLSLIEFRWHINWAR